MDPSVVKARAVTGDDKPNNDRKVVDGEPVAGRWALLVRDLMAGRSLVSGLSQLVRGTLDVGEVLRGVRSDFDRLIKSIVKPKQLLFASAADVALPNGGAYTVITPWVDIRRWRGVGVFLANTGGANPVTTVYDNMSADPAGAGPFMGGIGWASAVAIGSCIHWARAPSSATWEAVYAPSRCAMGIQIAGTSALGTTVRVAIIGVR